MFAMLAGVPGKLKTLLDRLTATRAGLLDNLNATVSSRMPGTTTERDRIDTTISSRMPGTTTHRDRIDTTISSRAPASTALNNATWTDGRAALLDKLNLLPTADGLAPIAGGLYPSTQSVSGASPSLNGFTTGGSRSSVGTTTIIDITGAGVLQYAALQCTTAGTVDQNIAAELRVTIDGVAHSVSLSTTAQGANFTRYLVGYINGAVVALDQVPFNVSLRIELIVTAWAVGGTAFALTKLRRVA